MLENHNFLLAIKNLFLEGTILVFLLFLESTILVWRWVIATLAVMNPVRQNKTKRKQTKNPHLLLDTIWEIYCHLTIKSSYYIKVLKINNASGKERALFACK